MKTTHDIRKIRAIVLYIVQRSGGVIDYISLFKKMYFAQQRCLVQYGRPLLPDNFRAMQLGPVPSFTYRALRYANNHEGEVSPELIAFASAFSVTDCDGVKVVAATEQPVMTSISGIERKVIDQVLSETEGLNAKQLSTLSHDRAWRSAHRRSMIDYTDNYMPPVSIAKAGGADEATIQHINEAQQFADIYCRI